MKPRWEETTDFSIIIEQCERWNRGRLYEIFWEYSDLNSHILRERKARAWLCYENNVLSGFALSRKVGKIFIIEELWANFDGLFGDVLEFSQKDVERVRVVAQIIERIKEHPILLRAAVDNYFAHGVARVLRFPWFNGFILAEKTLRKKITPSVPEGYSFRCFQLGDESFFSSLYKEVYSELVTYEEFRNWAMNKRARTTVATHGNEAVGFIIAERRSYDLIGDFAIAVSSAHQRKGVGGALFDAGLASLWNMRARKIIADYRTMNGATHALYSSRGFIPRRFYNYFLCKK